MTTKLFFSALILGASLSASAQAVNYPNGSTVADFTVTDTDGNSINLYTITASGKYVVLDFFFDTCGPCQTWQPTFNELYDKYGCNAGDIFCVSINNGTDTDAEVIAYENTYGGSFHHSPAVSADGGGGAVKTTFGVSAYPTFCLIGPDNKMIANDIWPLVDVSTFEAAFPVAPTPMACSFAGTEEILVTDLMVYPNPANQTANLILTAAEASSATIEIMNMQGEILLNTATELIGGTNKIQLDVANLSAGQYLIQVTTANTLQTFRFSIVH